MRARAACRQVLTRALCCALRRAVLDVKNLCAHGCSEHARVRCVLCVVQCWLRCARVSVVHTFFGTGF